MPLAFPIGRNSECLRETSAQNIAAPDTSMPNMTLDTLSQFWSGVGIDNMRLIHRLLVMALVFPIGGHSECLRETSAQNITAA